MNEPPWNLRIDYISRVYFLYLQIMIYHVVVEICAFSLVTVFQKGLDSYQSKISLQR